MKSHPFLRQSNISCFLLSDGIHLLLSLPVMVLDFQMALFWLLSASFANPLNCRWESKWIKKNHFILKTKFICINFNTHFFNWQKQLSALCKPATHRKKFCTMTCSLTLHCIPDSMLATGTLCKSSSNVWKQSPAYLSSIYSSLETLQKTWGPLATSLTWETTREGDLNFVNVFLLFHNYLPLKHGKGLNPDHQSMLSVKFGWN